jgi:hypothetical protein
VGRRIVRAFGAAVAPGSPELVTITARGAELIQLPMPSSSI